MSETVTQTEYYFEIDFQSKINFSSAFSNQAHTGTSFIMLYIRMCGSVCPHVFLPVYLSICWFCFNCFVLVVCVVTSLLVSRFVCVLLGGGVYSHFAYLCRPIFSLNFRNFTAIRVRLQLYVRHDKGFDSSIARLIAFFSFVAST